MPKTLDMSKEARINREYRKLRLTFRDLDPNMMKTVDSLIRNAAFMTVTLEDIYKDYNDSGYTEEYDNGGGQRGRKRSEAMKAHNDMTKNHTAVMRLLTDLVPPVRKKKSALQELRDE